MSRGSKTQDQSPDELHASPTGVVWKTQRKLQLSFSYGVTGWPAPARTPSHASIGMAPPLSNANLPFLTGQPGGPVTLPPAFDSGCHGRLVRPCGLAGGRMRHTHWQASCQWHPPKLSRTLDQAARLPQARPILPGTTVCHPFIRARAAEFSHTLSRGHEPRRARPAGICRVHPDDH